MTKEQAEEQFQRGRKWRRLDEERKDIERDIASAEKALACEDANERRVALIDICHPQVMERIPGERVAKFLADEFRERLRDCVREMEEM